MVPYELNDDDRRLLARHHRYVQAAIEVLANRKLGRRVRPRGIGKYEGGVRVRHSEIAISERVVQDDWRRQTEASEEELAVVAAIADIVDLVRVEGPEALIAFGTPDTGDPLRAMFNLYRRTANDDELG